MHVDFSCSSIGHDKYLHHVRLEQTDSLHDTESLKIQDSRFKISRFKIQDLFISFHLHKKTFHSGTVVTSSSSTSINTLTMKQL